MPTDLVQLEEVFSEALSKSPEERAGFVLHACGENAELRARVERLLAAHETARNFMAPRNPDPTLDSAHPLYERAGTRIGPYKLLEQIGEGGFGVVFMAAQEEPVRRRVALKIIKQGMDTRQVVARFEAERQALAMMDHPNIAKVFDAGATDAGRPYFVMELVRGSPITTFCDDQHLSPRERLELFASVCHAVQHAHQKGIVHRDIKPSNVLVSRYDDRPVVKIIDFGIAKATSIRLTEKTVFTELWQMIGTPAYMSPEQAGQSDLDIDTRSDIYSLGVLLYELLTATTPFDRNTLLQAGYGELQRIIREVDPPRPSTRLSALKATLASVAANRRVEPRKLFRLLQGDLDWIVMKCLEKDRRRRYQSASGLAGDIQRHLNDEAVEASPVSVTYRMSKFVRRHRGSVIAGAVTATSLLLGFIGTTKGMFWAMQERDRAVHAESRQREERDRANAERALAMKAAARSEQVQRFLQDMLASIDPETASTRDVTVREVLDQAAGRIETAFVDQPEVRAVLHDTIARTYTGLRLFDPARQHLEHAIALRRRHMPADALGLADALLRFAELPTRSAEDAEAALLNCRKAVAIYGTGLTPDDPRIAIAKAFEAHLAYAAKPEKRDGSDLWAATILPVLPLLGPEQMAQMPPEWAETIRQARTLQQSGSAGEARALLHQWRTDSLKRIGVMCTAGQFGAATQFARQQYAPMLEIPMLRPLVPLGMMSVVQNLKDERADPRVIEIFLGEVLHASRIVSGEESANAAWALCELAKMQLSDRTRSASAESSARESLRIRRKVLGDAHALTDESLRVLADALQARGDLSGAEGVRQERHDLSRRQRLVSEGDILLQPPASTRPHEP